MLNQLSHKLILLSFDALMTVKMLTDGKDGKDGEDSKDINGARESSKLIATFLSC